MHRSERRAVVETDVYPLGNAIPVVKVGVARSAVGAAAVEINVGRCRAFIIRPADIDET